MIIRMLNRAGAYLGPQEHLMGDSEFNERGHWEYVPVVQTNDAILQELGGYVWNMVPEQLPRQWYLNSPMKRWQEQAYRIINDLMLDFTRGAPLYAIKDPRLCITLPLWDRPIPKPQIIVCLRNPLQVAYSIYARDRMELLDGIRLWRVYNEHVLQHTSKRERLVVSYEDVLQYPEFESWRIARFLGLSLTDIADVVVEPQKRLQHYRFTAEEMRAMVGKYLEGPEADSVLFVYEQMLAEAHEPH